MNKDFMKRMVICAAAVLICVTACSHPGRWPNATIPYVLIGFDENETGILVASMFLWEQATGVNFKNVLFEDNDDDAGVLHIVKGNGEFGVAGISICGYEEDKLLLVVMNKVTPEAAVHELGHVLGLEHEHQRPDRDDYITINWENLDADAAMLLQFVAKQPRNYHYREFPYDYFSCMHYANKACARDPRMDTIVSPVPVGVYGIPSKIDIRKVRAIQGTD